MKVVYNALSVRPGVFDGATTFSLNIVPELAEALAGDGLVVVVREDETRFPSTERLRLERVALPAAGMARLAYETIGLRRLLRRLGSDVFVSPNESLPLGLPCASVVVAQNLVYHCGSVEGEEFRADRLRDRLAIGARAGYYRWSMPRAYRRATRVAAVSETTARVLEAGAALDAVKTRVVLEGADSRLLPSVEGVQREPRLLVVSSLSPYKGFERTLGLFAELHRHRPELGLDIVGSDWRGFGAHVERRVSALGLREVVRFLGELPPLELAERYARSLALLMLSECESFGLPLVEAMRYGLPVISSGRSSLAEIAAGAALEIGDDRGQAVRAVLGLLADERAREDLAARGFVRAAELTWRSAGLALASVVREAYAAGQPATPAETPVRAPESARPR